MTNRADKNAASPNRRALIAAALAGGVLTACSAQEQSSRGETSARREKPAPQQTPTLEQRRQAYVGFAVNTESWWRDLAFETRFTQAVKSGFTSAEFWFVGQFDRDAKALAGAIPAELKIAQIVSSTPPLARPDVRVKFLEDVKQAIADAKILGTDIITLTGHQNVDGISKSEALNSYRDHIAAAAALFEDANIYAAIEPFNPYDHPGHFIYGHEDALQICRDIASPFIKMNWDLFHMQRHEGNLIANLERGANQIAYMQLADSPSRHQPGTGEVDFINVIKACRAAGYSRPFGLELWAKEDDYQKALDDIYALSLKSSAED